MARAAWDVVQSAYSLGTYIHNDDFSLNVEYEKDNNEGGRTMMIKCIMMIILTLVITMMKKIITK